MSIEFNSVFTKDTYFGLFMILMILKSVTAVFLNEPNYENMKFYLAYLVTNNNELYFLNLEAFQIRKSLFFENIF